MINYLIFLMIPSLLAYFSNQTQRFSAQYWISVFLFLLFLSTFRYEIGSDQGDYNFTFMHYYFHNNTIDLILDVKISGFPNYELLYSLIELISFKLKIRISRCKFFLCCNLFNRIDITN